MNLRDEIKKGLILMEGAMRFPKKVNKDLVDLWESVLTSVGVEAMDLGPVTTQWLAQETDFPVPAEFIKLCLARKHDRQWRERTAGLTAEIPELPSPGKGAEVRLVVNGAKPALVGRFDSTEPVDYPDELTPEQRAEKVAGAQG